MARIKNTPDMDPFTPITSEADWDEKGWARESEPFSAVPRLGAVISIRLDPDGASLVRQAARLLGMTMSEFVQHAAVTMAAEALEEGKQ